MDKPEPKVLTVQLEKGPHIAKAVLHQYPEGKVTVHEIQRPHLPPLLDSDASFDSVPEAIERATAIWYGTLPG